MTMKEATIDAYQIALRSRFDYETAKRAVASERAFSNIMGPIVKSMLESMSKRLEVGFIYGQSATGLGTCDTISPVSSTSATVTITAASWAPGIWAGMKNATIDAVEGAAVVNTTGALTIVSVDMANRQITVTGAAADIALLITAAITGDNTYLVFHGAYGKEAPGADKIITNTGTLFGISADSTSGYELWRGNSVDICGALTLAKLDDAIVDAVAMGLDENSTVFISPKTWSKLMSTEAALRKYDASYKANKGENGFYSLQFHSQVGLLDVVSHPYVKQGEGFVIPMNRVFRVGSNDISFTNPNNEKIFLDIPDYAGYELRCFSNQTLFSEAPARMTKLTGITNS